MGLWTIYLRTLVPDRVVAAGCLRRLGRVTPTLYRQVIPTFDWRRRSLRPFSAGLLGVPLILDSDQVIDQLLFPIRTRLRRLNGPLPFH
jgi:hypothetical protein